MYLRALLIAGSAAFLAGCAASTAMSPPSPSAPVADLDEAIRYQTGACYGTCPVYVVTVRPDGAGTFVGERHTAVTGTRDFLAAPEAYRAFAASLAPLRPAQGERRVEPGSPDCGAAASDAPSVNVTWSGPAGERRLVAYFGCTSAEAQSVRERLRAAPGALPIERFIGPR